MATKKESAQREMMTFNANTVYRPTPIKVRELRRALAAVATSHLEEEDYVCFIPFEGFIHD